MPRARVSLVDEAQGFMGIDPGGSGGIALVSGRTAFAYAMPKTERDVFDRIARWAPMTKICVIEQVSAMPGQGVTSSFTFGRSYGSLRMALIAAGISFEQAAPGKWQRSMRCLTGGNKNVTKAKAQELFPALRITHAIADALLLAEFARRQYGS